MKMMMSIIQDNSHRNLDADALLGLGLRVVRHWHRDDTATVTLNL